MLKAKYFLLFLVFAILICTCSCSNAENVPSFIKVNNRYSITTLSGGGTITVEEIDKTGWIKSKEGGTWFNLNNIREIREMKPAN